MPTSKPTIGLDLFRQLAELSEATRLHATSARNFHAAALHVVLEALRAQAESEGSRVWVVVGPEVV